ncbi:hypothetical protein BJ322DRAFT_98965 [Thelephora terrestris]|uniref:Uncharacterized protein n=1 Tax=Thelephora terrestris TaxID=56493 RepID=A0A9P6HT54_9AGAM|nr:hypothetical protein BJ322DRAFT_98965 [Thelephora terrestris]
MCNLETEGTKFGCGHYQITRQLRKIDCGNRYCRHSIKHPQICPGCACQIFLGPDKSETITSIDHGHCNQCVPCLALRIALFSINLTPSVLGHARHLY